jgi:hypothetical protein
VHATVTLTALDVDGNRALVRTKVLVRR